MGGVKEAGRAGDDLHAVARQLGLGDVGLRADHLVDAKAEVGHGDLVFDAVIDAVDPLKLEAGEVQNGFPHGFTGDGSGVDADATDDVALLDYNDATAGFGGLNGGSLTGGAGADHDHVVGAHAD